jgi:hypothetical protein
MPEPAEKIDEEAKSLRRRHLHRVLEPREPEFRYGLLLLLLFITFLFVGSAPTGTHWVPFVTVVIESLTLLVAIVASGARGWLVKLSIVVIALGVISTALAWILNDDQANKAASVLGAVLVLVGPVVVVRGLVRRRNIDLRTVLGALSLYMMAGLFFANVYNAIQAFTHQPFFVQTSHAGAPTFLYFSFVTMTTVGYGDFTAAHQFGRTLAAFEAIFGQFYLVTVVAVLVSNMGPVRSRLPKPAAGDGGGDDERAPAAETE